MCYALNTSCFINEFVILSLNSNIKVLCSQLLHKTHKIANFLLNVHSIIHNNKVSFFEIN